VLLQELNANAAGDGGPGTKSVCSALPAPPNLAVGSFPARKPKKSPSQCIDLTMTITHGEHSSTSFNEKNPPWWTFLIHLDLFAVG